MCNHVCGLRDYGAAPVIIWMVKTRKQRSEDWHSKSLKMTSGAALADFGIQKCFTLRASTSTIEIRGTGEAPRGRGPEKVKQETRPMKMEKGNLHLARLIVRFLLSREKKSTLISRFRGCAHLERATAEGGTVPIQLFTRSTNSFCRGKLVSLHL